MDVECWKEKRDMEPFMATASGISVRSGLHGIPSRECRTCAAILLWSYGLPVALGAHGGVDGFVKRECRGYGVLAQQ